MSYSVGSYFEDFIKTQVEIGRYNNASEVVREGLRLIEQRELKFLQLKDHVESALEKGGDNSDEEVESFLAENQE